MAKQSKQAAGYIHDKGTQYQCKDCYKFEPNALACVEVRGTIRPLGGCNTFVFGRPGTGGGVAAKLTQIEAGYLENPAGFSCKRCEYFDRQNWDCRKVDANSPGPDAGIIHPNACCNNWEKNEVLGGL